MIPNYEFEVLNFGCRVRTMRTTRSIFVSHSKRPNLAMSCFNGS